MNNEVLHILSHDGSKEFKEFTSKEENVEPIIEEVVVKKLVVKKPVAKKTGKKTTNKK